MRKILSLVLSVVAASSMALTTNAWAQLGSSSSDLVFTPITPCRLLDTRSATTPAGTPIAANSTRSFLVWNQTSFAIQGGAATNCGLTASSNTAALAINFTVVAPDTGGYITAFPADVTKPGAATLNYEAGSVRGNSAIVKIAQGSPTALSVFTTSKTHLVADVVGYYAKPISSGSLECVDVTNSGIIPATSTGTATVAACTLGYTQTALSCDTDSYGMNLTGQRPSARTCYYNNTSAFSATGAAVVTCCKIPGR